MAEQYTPDDFRRDLRRVHGYASLRIVRDAGDDAVRKFDEILARVRRDAAREFVVRTLLDWGIGEDEDSDLSPATAGDLRAAVDDTYPEESP